jgi:hypothetical protein
MLKSVFLLSLLSFTLMFCQKKEFIEPSVPVLSSKGKYTINFGGYTWKVKNENETKKGPGPNYYNKENVSVDNEGRLHLKLKKDIKNNWTCAELETEKLFGFGSYQFWVEGRLDLFDKNIVLGLFNYPCEADLCQPEGTHEIDIEFSKWGNNAETKLLNFTTYASIKTENKSNFPFLINLKNSQSTHRFTRTKTAVNFQSMYGFQNKNANVFASVTSNKLVSTLNMPVHINLWMYLGNPPSDGKEVEIIINDFKFVAQ